ncbi:MAG: 3'-5' exonuclease [Oscillospiraceae bacterium]
MAEELAFSGQYKIIVIDEYQDVNNLQEVIFKCLSDAEDPAFYGKNVFLVGDVKQAIYGFRQANPLLFTALCAQAQREENADLLERIPLSRNFRSRRGVIDFVNFLFGGLMSVGTGGVDYTGSERLVCGASFGDVPDEPPTELMLLRNFSLGDDAEASGGDESLGDETVAAICEQEHTAIAARIRKLLDDRTQVFENGVYRDCAPGDFCILTRSRTANNRLTDALAAAGLTAATEETDGYLRSREISVMVSLLQVLDNPMQDIPMLSVLLSPVFLFDADEVARLKTAAKQVGVNKLYGAVCAAAADRALADDAQYKQIDADDALRAKCRTVADTVRRLRFYASGMPLERLIRKIYDETGFCAATARQDYSARRLANLRLLQKYAADYDANTDGGLTGFLRYMKSVFAAGSDFEQASAAAENAGAVKIKTMHKSKGLEFPFVFLSGLYTEFNSKDLSKALLLSETGGVGIKLKDPAHLRVIHTACASGIRMLKERELRSEEMRLLYVALTRAKERLFLPLALPQKWKTRYFTAAMRIAQSGGQTDALVQTAKCMQDWLVMSMLTHPDAQAIREAAGAGDFDLITKVAAPTVVFANPPAQVAADSSPVKIRPEAAPDRALSQALAARFSQPAPAAGSLAAKLSVSQAVKEDTDFVFFPQVPKFSDEIGRLSAAQKGTLTHRFMELADFARAERDVTAELDRLTAAGFFTKRERAGIYTDAVRKFFATDFYRRIAKSNKILREKKFLVRISDLNLGGILAGYDGTNGMLQGIADLIFAEDDGYVIVDYKTDNVTSFDALADNYAMQLALYKAAFDLLLDMPVKSCYIYSFRLSEGGEIKL